ncbi:MAG: iron-sulfur cluster assembly scaffold protein [bacterium]
MDLYREEILEHYKNPKNFGKIEGADVSVVTENHVCGDHMEMQMNLDQGKVAEIRFFGESCAISRAAASLLTESVIGKTLSELKQITKEEHLGRLKTKLSPSREMCAMLSFNILQQIIKQAEQQKQSV